MKQQTQQKSNRKWVVGILAAMVVTFSTYAYAIAGTTVVVAEAKSMSSEIQEMQTEIAELELEFFDVVNDFSIADAGSVGLFETQAIAYVEVGQAPTVALNTQ